MSRPDSFVVFSLDGSLFALPAAEVVEVSKAGEVQTFPHTSAKLEGVILHRGAVLPVWDLAGSLGVTSAVPKKFCLLARHNFVAAEPTAIPVSSEGQMLRSEMLPPATEAPAHVRGVLVIDGRQVEVLDLQGLRNGGQVKGYDNE